LYVRYLSKLSAMSVTVIIWPLPTSDYRPTRLCYVYVLIRYIRFHRFISKQWIVSFMRSYIPRLIWFHFMAIVLGLFGSLQPLYFRFRYFFSAWALNRCVIEMTISFMNIGIVWILHYLRRNCSKYLLAIFNVCILTYQTSKSVSCIVFGFSPSILRFPRWLMGCEQN
jgi:hypothetical protein